MDLNWINFFTLAVFVISGLLVGAWQARTRRLQTQLQEQLQVVQRLRDITSVQHDIARDLRELIEELRDIQPLLLNTVIGLEELVANTTNASITGDAPDSDLYANGEVKP